MLNRKILALVIGGCLGASAVHAQDAAMGYVGADLGWAKASLTGNEGRLIYGAQGGMLLMDGMLGVGVYFDMGAKKKNGAKQDLMTYGLDVDYYATDLLPGLYAGLKIGMETIKYDLLGSYGALAWGPELGYDYVVGSGVSVGAEGSFLFVAKKDKTYLGVAADQKSHNTWALAATVKYWF